MHGVPVPFAGAFWQVPARHASEPAHVFAGAQHACPCAPQLPPSADVDPVDPSTPLAEPPSLPPSDTHPPLSHARPVAQMSPVQHVCPACPHVTDVSPLPPLPPLPPLQPPPTATASATAATQPIVLFIESSSLSARLFKPTTGSSNK